MYERWQKDNLKHALTVRRGVHLTGARQCGKTTLADCIRLDNCRNYTLDDDDVLATAISDPKGFVKHRQGETLMIDEVQKAPILLNAIKMVLDKDNSKGQYLLTGSSNLRFAKAVKDSLAGRLARIRLRTLALGEIHSGKGDFLMRAFARDWPYDYPEMDKRDVIRQAFLGGYPEARELGQTDRKKWFVEYLDDILTKDIQDVTEIRKLDSLKKAAHWLIAYSSKFFEFSDLGRSAQLTKETVKGYVTALQALYLVDAVEPWAGNDYSRLGKRTKYFVTDPALMANILGWNEEQTYLNADESGKLIETWVYHELASLMDLSGEYAISQYRDTDKREIDFIIKHEDGRQLGIEVKAGGVGHEDFKHLKWIRKDLIKDGFIGLVLYTGDKVLPFGEDLYAVPMSALMG